MPPWTPLLASCASLCLSLCFAQHNSLDLSQTVKNLSTKPESNQTFSCSLNADLCVKQNQTCNGTTGLCECPSTKPIHLSNEIPCLRAKLLGQVCLHSQECGGVSKAACFATILFPVELLSLPTYRQWYIYNQITESDELNYLLNKVYGECRCQAGYRATGANQCVPKGRDTMRACANHTECVLEHSLCELGQNRCLCSDGFYHDPERDLCIDVGEQYQQFCVVSADCQVRDPNLRCVKSRCVCESGHRRTNQTKCTPSSECTAGQVWNRSSASCESPSLLLHSFLVKIVLILLLKLIICNLVRIVCIRRRAFTRHNPRARYAEGDGQSIGQSHSLLSLPPYEAVFSEPPSATPAVEYLPTYDEALESVRNNQGYQVLKPEKESEEA